MADAQSKTSYLLRVAQRYIWWKSPEDAIKYPQIVLARVMNMGTWDDLCELSRIYAEEDLRVVLREAEAGQFNERSWYFWHYRLMGCALGEVPDLPKRRSSQ